MLEAQQQAIDRMLSQSTLSRPALPKEAPPVVDRLLEEGEAQRLRLQAKQRAQLELEMAENRPIPAINKSYTSTDRKPIYERYPEVLRERNRHVEDISQEVQYERGQKDPDYLYPAFQPNLDKSNNSFTFRKDHSNFFDFLRQVQSWNESKQKKVRVKQEAKRQQETAGLSFTPTINTRSRKILQKRAFPEDVLARMNKLDAKRQLNKSILEDSMRLTHSPQLHSKKHEASPRKKKYSKKEALDRSGGGYLPYLKQTVSTPNIFRLEGEGAREKENEATHDTPRLKARFED